VPGDTTPLPLLSRDSYNLEYYGVRCKYCSAPRFHEEAESWCCRNGTRIAPQPWRDLEKDYASDVDRTQVSSALKELHTLLETSAPIQQHARLYQSLCAPASFNADFVALRPPSCMYVCGNGYHKYVPGNYRSTSESNSYSPFFTFQDFVFTLSLFPDKSFIPAMAWFVCEDKSVLQQNEALQKLDSSLVEQLSKLLAQVSSISSPEKTTSFTLHFLQTNPWITGLVALAHEQSANAFLEFPPYETRISGHRPSIPYIGAYFSDLYSERSIVIYKKGEPDATPMIIDRLSPYYEPLHYVLMFTDGVLGWSPALLSADPVCFLLSWKHHCTGIFTADS